NVEPSGFLVSKRENTGEFLDLPVLLWSDVKDDLPDDTGIILAVSRENASQILTNIGSTQFEIFSMSDEYVKQLEGFLTHEYSFMEMAVEKNKPVGLLKIDPNLPEWQSVLVMRFDLIGDNLENMPFLRELRRNLPKSRIVMLARAGLEDLYACCPYVDEAIFYDVDAWADCERLKDFANRYLQGFGTVILTRVRSYPNEYTVEEMLLMLYSSAAHRLTWDMKETEYSSIHNDLYSDFFSFWDVIDKDTHHVQYMLTFLQNLGAKISDEKMEAWIASDANVWAEAWINKQNLSFNKLLAAVALVGSAPYKNYPPRLFRLVFQKLSQTYPGLIFILLGGSDAVGAAEKLGQVSYVLNLAGKTSLAQTMAIINKCDFYLGADTGLMHMAPAFNKPVVEISCELPDAKFNDTSCHHFTGAFGVPTKVCMARSGLDGCSRQCVVGKPHCITQILPDEIVDAVRSLLEECGLLKSKG
ncbi:MAG: glycosyltransferase family 9 protein, partial [Selenomonadaceae bacterium]|nr:glycosyltransferase family 9 protein [Selenomonadaceae bacterium]